MNMSRDQKIAYAAGLFDGEGTVGVYKVTNGRKTQSGQKCYWATRIAITGTYRPMIERLYQWFQLGSVTIQKRQAKRETPSRDYELCKQSWKWIITNKHDVKEFLTQIRPFLAEKADQVDVVLKHIDGELNGPVASKLCKEAKKFEFKYGEEIFKEVNFKGSNNPIAKLNEQKVREIKVRALNGERQVDLAREFGVKKSVICSILKGRSWKHVLISK